MTPVLKLTKSQKNNKTDKTDETDKIDENFKTDVIDKINESDEIDKIDKINKIDKILIVFNTLKHNQTLLQTFRTQLTYLRDFQVIQRSLKSLLFIAFSIGKSGR